MPDDTMSSAVPVASHPSRSRSQGKHKKREHSNSRDRDKDKGAKKRKKDHKEKKNKSHRKEKRNKDDKRDSLKKQQIEVKGQCGQSEEKADHAEVATKSEKPAGQERPAYSHQGGTASVIGQIRVTEQTRRLIADGGCSSSVDIDGAKRGGNGGGVIIGSFGRLSPPVCGGKKKVPGEAPVADRMSSSQEDKRKRKRRSPSSPRRRRRSSASCRGGDGGRRRGDRSSSTEEKRRKRGRADGSSRSSRRRESRVSRREGRDSRSRSGSRRSSGSSRSSDASDLSVKRGSDGGRLKIDRERLRRRALENTVLRLDERCPRKLADMPCFKALGVRVSELEEICRRLAPSRQSLEKVDAPSAASISEHQQQQGGNKDCGKSQAAASLDPASSSVCGSSTAVRHPFQLRAETSTGSGSSSSRFSGSLLSAASGDKSVAVNKPLDKKELLSAFPVSSGEFHRHQDNTSALALTAPSQLDLSSVSSAVEAAFDSSDKLAAVKATPTGVKQAAPASAGGIQINILQHKLPVDYRQPLLQPWVPVATATGSGSSGPSSLAVPKAASAVEHQRVLQLGDWATAKLLAAKSAPQALLQQQQQQQRSKSPQAWVTKHQFECARPITGGIGRQLMEKMGWRHGQGLGKRNEGPTEPLAIDYKTDRKGLASQEDKQQQQQDGKHPVSVLMELTKQRRWPDPLFRQVEESGPPHDRCFVFCVRVFGTEYQPDRPSKNKKDAKASAATLALQKLGLLPTS